MFCFHILGHRTIPQQNQTGSLKNIDFQLFWHTLWYSPPLVALKFFPIYLGHISNHTKFHFCIFMGKTPSRAPYYRKWLRKGKFGGKPYQA